MAIQISGTTVIDNGRNITNVLGVGDTGTTVYYGDGSNLSGGSFSSGTAMLFQQTAAPTGWTKSTTHDNKALRLVSGTAGSGGSSSFTTVFTSRSASGTVGSTTLTTTQMPSHTHTFNGQRFADGILGVNFGYTGGGSRTTSSTGGGSSHNHSFTGSTLDFAVQYVDVIIATKD